MQRLLLVIGIVLALAALAFGAVLFSVDLGGFIETTDETAVGEAITDEQRQRVRTVTGLDLPPATVYHAYHYESALDQAVLALVTLPRADADSLLAQGTFGDASWRDVAQVPSSMSDRPDWPRWQPDGVTVGRWTALDLAPGRRLAVLVDEADADTRTLYLLWNTY